MMNRSDFTLLLLTCTLFISRPVFSQWDANTSMGENALEVRGMGQQDDIQAIQDRKMIVMLLTEDAKVVSKMRKSGDTTSLMEYRNSIKNFNDDFVQMVDSLWPFHKEFTYLGYDTIQDMDKLVKPEYAVMYFVRYEVYIESGDVKTKTSYDINWDGHLLGSNDYSDKSRSSVDYYTVFKIAKVEEFRRTPPIQVSMPHVIPTKTDMAFGLNFCTWYIKQKMRGNDDKAMRTWLDDNSHDLAKLTLVINADDVKHNAIDDPYNASYPFKFNVIPADMYEWIVLSRSPGYAYLVMNCGKPCVIRADDGEPLYLSRLYDWNALITFRQMGKEVERIVKGK